MIFVLPDIIPVECLQVLFQFYCHHPVFRTLHGHFRHWCPFIFRSEMGGGQAKCRNFRFLMMTLPTLEIIAVFFDNYYEIYLRAFL